MRLSFGYLAALLVLGAGCGDDEGSDGTGGSGGSTPEPCEAGFELAEDGTCQPVAPLSCGPLEVASGEPAMCTAVGWADACPEGFVLAGEPAACAPVLPVECAAGTRPLIGGTCEPVGFVTCPSGFTLVDGACFDVLPAAPCVGATREVLGETTCQPVGDCGNFPAADATLFVDDSFSAGQLDGTHFLTIGEALAAATNGDVIAVDTGTYVESLTIGAAVRVEGRCAADVEISSPSGTAPGISVDTASPVIIEGVTLTGHNRGVVAGASDDVTVIDSVLDGNFDIGVFATLSGVIRLEGTVVRGTLTGSGDPHGIEASSGGTIELVDSNVVESEVIGAFVSGTNSTLTLDRSIIRYTQPDAGDEFGVGLVVREGGDASLSESVIANGKESGIVAIQAGTSVTLTRSVVRDMEAGVFGYGRGLDIETGATATLEDVTVARTVELGVYTTSNSTTLDATRVSVLDTAATPFGTFGVSAYVRNSSVGTFENCRFERFGDEALLLDASASATLRQSQIKGANGPASTFGYGIAGYFGTTTTLEDVAIENARTAGIVLDSGGALNGSNVILRHVDADPSGAKGRGLVAIGGSTASLTSSAIDRATEFGVFADGEGSSVTLDQVAVVSTQPRPSDMRFGRGIGAQNAAQVTATRVLLAGNHEAGAFASGIGTSLSLDRVTIHPTAPPPGGELGVGLIVQKGAQGNATLMGLFGQTGIGALCGAEGSALSVAESIIAGTTFGLGSSGGFADGVTTFNGAAITLRKSTIRDHGNIGVAFAAATGLIDQCAISNNPIALHTQGGSLVKEAEAASQPAPLDIVVTNTSEFIDNGTKVGSEVLPIPSLLPDGG